MPHLSPRTLTQAEQEAILRVTAAHPRDHAIVSLALGTGLRLGEIVGLDVGDVFTPDGTPRRRVTVSRKIAKNGRAGDVFLPHRLLPKLTRLGHYKLKQAESVARAAPLFCAQSGARLSKRRVQAAWRAWQRKAGIDPPYRFHCLRHAAITNVYRASRDLFLAQRFARHASPLTTTVYTHPSDEDLQQRVQTLAC